MPADVVNEWCPQNGDDCDGCDACCPEWDYTGGYSRADLLFGGNW